MDRKILIFMSQEGSTSDAPTAQLLDDYTKVLGDFFSNNCQFKYAKKNLKALLNAAFSNEFLIKEPRPELKSLHEGLTKLIGITGNQKTKDAIGRLPEADD